MKRIFFLLLAVIASLMTTPSYAQAAGPRQDINELRSAIAQFLQNQAVGLPGQVDVVVGNIDPHLNLAACLSPEPFLPKGSRAWGKTSVGVRCHAPASWTIYVKATVKVETEYVIAAMPLTQGQTISAADLSRTRGDLTALPSGVITDTSQAIGQKVAMAIALGAPIRKDLLRSQQVVQPGQTVRVVTAGPGFKVSTEGRAMGSANDGQTVQIRMASGQTVSGIARTGGIVEVVF